MKIKKYLGIVLFTCITILPGITQEEKQQKPENRIEIRKSEDQKRLESVIFKNEKGKEVRKLNLDNNNPYNKLN